MRDALRLGRRVEPVDKTGADRVGHRDMRDAARSEEALLAGKGAVDELVDKNEAARRQLLAEGATGRNRDEVGNAGPLQRVDIGAVVDGGRRPLVSPPWRGRNTIGSPPISP